MEVKNMVERERTETRSILSEVLETHLLPPERFKARERVGDVVDIKKIGNTVALLEKAQDHYEGGTYDAKGNVSRVILDPSSQDLVKNTRKENVVLAGPGSGYWPENGVSYRNLIGEMGYSDKTVDQLKKDWQTRSPTYFTVKISRHTSSYGNEFDGKHYIEKKEINSKPPLFLKAGDWKLAVREDKRKNQSFVFTVGDNHFEVQPHAPNKTGRIKTKEGFQDENTLLIGDLQIRKNDGIFNVVDKIGKILASYSGTSLIADPSKPNNLHFIDKGQVFRLGLDGFKTAVARPSLEQVKLQEVQDPKTLNFDPNGNFFVITAGENKLLIVDKESGDVVRTFENAKGPVLVDNQGNILFVDTENRLREIQTNFQTITTEGKKEALVKKAEALSRRQDEFAKLELPTVARPQTSGLSQADVANTLRETISRQVTEKITTSTNPQELEGVLDSLQALKSDPANQAYQEVVDEFVNKARDRLSGIRVGELDGELNAFQQVLGNVNSAEDSIGLDQQFAKLLQLRQKIEITDYSKRRETDQRIREVQERKDTLIARYQQELVQTVESRFPEIKEVVVECGSTHELAYLSTSGQVQQFEMMLADIRDPQVRRELRDKYNAVRAEQRIKLEESSSQLAEQDRLRWAQIIEDSREDLASLQEQIAQLADSREIDHFGRDPLVAVWRNKLSSLPEDLRENLEKRLEVILGARKKELVQRQELGAVGEEGVLKFGNSTFPIYKEPPRIWQPNLIPIKGGFSGFADLVFEDSQGRVYRPGGEHEVVVSTDMNDQRTKEAIDRYRLEADEYFRGIKRKVPELNERWRIPSYQMSNLEELTESINLQLAHHMGITILEGETGTGKNVLADMLANLSNREIVTISCNRKTTKEDLSYEFYYDQEKGTYKLPSTLVEGLQTPGTIIIFDEINTLEPGVVKMLSSVFDYRRRLYSSEGGGRKETVIDPTVILIGAMNPQDYIGVERLAETISSRADIIEVGYPPFEEIRNGRTYYRSDEAEILAAHMHSLEQLSQKDFQLSWDNLINRDATNGADIILRGNPQIETDIRRVYDVIRAANRLREMYKGYQLGSANEPMDFVTSLRETINIVLRMNYREGVKEIVKRVILPKVGDRRQREMANKTIDLVLP